MKLNSKFNYKTTPVADKRSVVQGDKYRFTVLTERLIRAEYSETGCFIDDATQVVVNRCFEPVDFKVEDSEGMLVITTDAIEITYLKKPFDERTLIVKYLIDDNEYKGRQLPRQWRYNTKNEGNLGGTARTLDAVDGRCGMGDGIMSKGHVTVLDDSKSLIVTSDGEIIPKKEECTDSYLFCYGNTYTTYDYKKALKDYYKLTGKTPLIPRFTLGNWWSRYYAYTQDEYTDLMKRFKEEDIPFSVSVIDMDWHNVKIPAKYGTGWTGYTWNKDLFPDHKAMLEFLHDEGLKVTLNVHPDGGVSAVEEAYPKMAKAMGIDPETEETVEFDMTDSRFIDNYFELLHHPLEKEGVDFWWLDWQQGTTTKLEGLDPLWMLNHLHYIDSGRDNKRPLTFSRYAGPGSHRYPIGFSGDTIVSWESLKFQPEFTATASNIGYGWWSHDIGGHMKGYRDDELTARWVQYGVFSPINRLHSSNSLFSGKEPWKYNKMCEITMKKFLKLRHELIPYLYSMNYRAHKFDEPIVMPLYYNWNDNKAFEYKNEYTFGTEMLVSPITDPADSCTQMGCARTYLPEGVWYDFFNQRKYVGDKVINIYRDIYEMPVFVKAGGIVPMAKLTHINDIENPENMKIKVFAGADNIFELYEDDGETNDFEIGKYAFTKMELKWSDKPEFVINAPVGDGSVIPQSRNYDIEFVGIEKTDKISAYVDGKKVDFNVNYTDASVIVSVYNVNGALRICFDEAVKPVLNDVMDKIVEIATNCQMPYKYKEELYWTIKNGKSLINIISDVSNLDIDPILKNAVMEILTAEV